MSELKNPLNFNALEEAQKYINSLSIKELKDFRNLVLSKEKNLRKLEGSVRRYVRMYILMASHEDYKDNYLKLLDLTNKYGHRILELIERESKTNEIYEFNNDVKSLEELRKVTLDDLSKLYDLTNITNPLCTILTNRLKTLATVMVNFSNSCNKQVFGKPIDKDLHVVDLPICVIGKKDKDGNWDYKACQKRLKDQLLYCLHEETADLENRIKKNITF